MKEWEQLKDLLRAKDFAVQGRERERLELSKRLEKVMQK